MLSIAHSMTLVSVVLKKQVEHRLVPAVQRALRRNEVPGAPAQRHSTRPPAADGAREQKPRRRAGRERLVLRCLQSMPDKATGMLALWKGASRGNLLDRGDLGRQLHTLKGDCELLGLTPISELVIALEQVLERAPDSAPFDAQVVVAGRNALESLRDVPQTVLGAREMDVRLLIADLGAAARPLQRPQLLH